MKINEVTPEILQDPSRFPEIQKALVDAVQYGDTADAMEFRLQLQDFFRVYSDMEESEPELFKNYRKLILYIELELFEHMPEDIQVEILKRYFSSFARLKLDPAGRIQQALLLENPILEDDKKDTFMAALLNNQQLIGSERIELNGQMVKPTMGNWVTKYRTAFGTKSQDPLVALDFSSRDEARVLNDQDRELLQKVLEVVEMLKIDEKTADEYTVADDSVQGDEPGLSPLYVPSKKPKVSMDDLKKYNTAPLDQPTKSFDAKPAQQVTPVSPQPQPQAVSGATFQSLADLPKLDQRMVASMGISMTDFVYTLKNEVLKVYTRSPESKPHIAELWRQSPLYRLYSEMGDESMNTRKSIDEIVTARKDAKRATLSKEEFDLVSDLSRVIQ